MSGSATATAPPGHLLAARGGFAVVPLLGEAARGALLEEALSLHAARGEVVRAEEDPAAADERGAAARWFETAPGGPALRALYTAPALQATLAWLTGTSWLPLGDQATYSFYREEGHFLGLHRDIVQCELAVIACLHDDGEEGALSVWPTRAADPLSVIRADPERGRIGLALGAGEALVLLGGIVPHAVDPLGAGRTRVTAPMCFRPA
jgi:hypothetical protein